MSSCFDNLPDLEGSGVDAAKTNIVHFAGYAVRKLNVADSGEDTFPYYEKYGDYTALLDRSGLRLRWTQCVSGQYSLTLCFSQLRQKSVEHRLQQSSCK